MSKPLRLLMIGLLAAALPAQAPKAVEITDEPFHHLVLENESVRVFHVEIPPGRPTLLHRHRNDYVFVSLGASQVRNAVEGKEPVTLKLADGEARLVAGGFAHVARNLGSTPLRTLAVEVLAAGRSRTFARRNPKAKWERGLEVLPGGTMHTVLVKGGMRVTDVDLQSGGAVPLHTHTGPHLAVAITDLDVRLDEKGKPPVMIRKKAGEFEWMPAGVTHTVTNTSKAGIRFVGIEFR